MGTQEMIMIRSRRQQGAALIEGVIALSMIIGGTVLAVLLLTNIGVSIYYKQKLGVVSNYTAQFVAQRGPTVQPQEVASKAQEMATSMGLPNVQVVSIDFPNADLATVTLRLNGTLMGRGDIMPAMIDIRDTCSAPRSTGPMGFYYFQVSDSRHGWVPLYSLPTAGLPTWHFQQQVNHWGPGGLIFTSTMRPIPGGAPGPTTF